jgi:hypothetical protein
MRGRVVALREVVGMARPPSRRPAGPARASPFSRDRRDLLEDQGGFLIAALEAAVTSGNGLPSVSVISRCWARFQGPATAQAAHRRPRKATSAEHERVDAVDDHGPPQKFHEVRDILLNCRPSISGQS